MKGIKQSLTDFGKWFQNTKLGQIVDSAISSYSGYGEIQHLKKADELAQQTQDYNEQYSAKQLAEQQRQFDLTSGQAQQNIDWQKSIAEKNLALQQDTFAAQMAENELTRQREDSAYQRQIADLKAAGFSPLMASNGAGAASMSVGNAPQYDTSGVSTAQGSAIQLAQEYAQLKNMATGQYLSRRQEAANMRQGAKLALSQLDKERRLGFQNLVLDSINTATNISRARWQNATAEQQINYSKAEQSWNEKNGWRNRDVWNTLVPVISQISKNLGVTTESLSNAIYSLPGKLQEVLQGSPDKQTIINVAGNNKTTSVLSKNLTSDEMVEGLLIANLPRLNDTEMKKLAAYYYPKLDEKRRNSLTEDGFYQWIKRDGWQTVFGISFGLWK